MARNTTSSRAMRQRKKGGRPEEGDSKYGRKRRSGRMMYGPGCGPGGFRARGTDK